MQDLEKVLDM
jgi:hypothetical protein